MSEPAVEVGDKQTEANSTPRRWFHFRLRVLAVAPLALLVLFGFYAPRQMAQRRALVALRENQAVVRTDPIAVPGVEWLFGKDYAQEITEVYWLDPKLTDDKLEVLRGLPSITKLELAGSQVSSAGLAHISGLPNLYTLHLANTKVDDKGLAHLGGLKNLGILSLDRTGVTDGGLELLGRMRQLERLYLDGTALTDKGLAHLAGLNQLKELSAVDTKITDAGLKHLTGLKGLEMLKVYNTEVTREGMEELHRTLPQCVIWIPTE